MRRFVLFGIAGVVLPVMFFVAVINVANIANAVEYTSAESIAADKNKEIARDFKIQGEYKFKEKNNKEISGINIVAHGKGKFSIVAFGKGLPGDGWESGSRRAFANAVINGETLVMKNFEYENKDNNGKITRDKTDRIIHCKIEDGEILIPQKVEKNGKSIRENNNNNNEDTMTKVYRKSTTLGLKVPDGGIQLFLDGKSSDILLNPKVNESAKTLWSEVSTKPFERRPYTLHLEFLTSYMPDASGQGRSNSGVYIDESYECQILDSFGLEGLNNECGGFYQQAAPKLNMCYPPLQWQTYDIDFVPAKFENDGKKIANAKITVKHNGVLIHENFEPKHETPGRKKESPEPKGLYLQGHGNKVQFNNIWIKYKD
ncbi:MAG: DUF1080 domain-containing protein [Planctomycetaceae bacterium]|jgi:hypothetical protein|nr:DUF1080 domain-containing protein [Planctomycetaceae bacterium]